MSAPGKLLAQSDSWCCWKLVDGKKPPFSARGNSASGHSEKHSAEWADFETASKNAEAHGLGVGFVFRKNRGLVFVDIDGCVKDRIVHPAVAAWLAWLPTYTEISVSGTGIHAVCLGKIPKNLPPTPIAEGVTLEMYSHSRYMAYTGDRISEADDLVDCQIGIDKLWKEFGDGDPEPGPCLPMSRAGAIKIHQDNLAKLLKAMEGQGNPLANNALFFAGRLRASGVLDDSALQAIRDIVTKEWPKPISDRLFDQWAHSWRDGIENGPIEIREDTEAELAVAELNEKFFVVEDLGTRCRLAWFEEETEPELRGMQRLKHQSFEDFRNRYLNQLVDTGGKKSVRENGETVEKPVLSPKGHLWLKHPNRRQYRRVVFRPERETAPDIYNLWQGFAYEAREGDCRLYLAHLKENICSGSEEHYDYTIKWTARAVQMPWERGHVALVWRGEKGIGKNVAAEGFAKLFGPHAWLATNPEHVVGRFNAHLRGKCVLVANESFYAGNRQHEAALKGLITDVTLPIEAKFVDAETDINLLHFIIMSNNDWVVPASGKERRFFMVDVSDAHREDFAYFDKLQKQLEKGGYEALLWRLKTLDLAGFNVREVPKTEALQSQMAESLTGVEAVWFECLQRGEIPGHIDAKTGEVTMRGTDLINWANNQHRRDWNGISAVKLGFLFGDNPRGKNSKGMEFTKSQADLKIDPARAWQWYVPTLSEARAKWDLKRFPARWENGNAVWKSVLDDWRT